MLDIGVCITKYIQIWQTNIWQSLAFFLNIFANNLHLRCLPRNYTPRGFCLQKWDGRQKYGRNFPTKKYRTRSIFSPNVKLAIFFWFSYQIIILRMKQGSRTEIEPPVSSNQPMIILHCSCHLSLWVGKGHEILILPPPTMHSEIQIPQNYHTFAGVESPPNMGPI